MTRKSRRRTPRDDRAPPALSFDDDREETATDRAARTTFPAARVAELGRSGGETPDGHVTADDLSPETLLDDDPSRSPAIRARRVPLDRQLRRDDATAGMGSGPDEAELAERDPVGRDEARKLRQRSEAHAIDARFMEPAGAAEAADRRRR